MYGEEFVGGVVGIVGWENFSPAARGVGAIFANTFVSASIMPTTSIAIYDDGNVLEVVNVEVSAIQHRYSVQLLNGRVIDIQRREDSKGWETLSLTFLAFMPLILKYDYAESDAILKFYDSIEASAGFDELEEERQLLQEMIDDSDRYLSVPDAVYQRRAELGI